MTNEVEKYVSHLFYSTNSYCVNDFTVYLHSRLQEGSPVMEVMKLFHDVFKKAPANFDFKNKDVLEIVNLITDPRYEHLELPMFDVLKKLPYGSRTFVDQHDFPAHLILSYVFETCDVQSYTDNTIRKDAIDTVYAVLESRKKANGNVLLINSERWIRGYLKCLEGERDAKVLLSLFTCVRFLQSACKVDKELQCEWFDAIAAYYPIRYSSKLNNDVTSQQLNIAIQRILTDRDTFSNYTLDFVIEKLKDGDVTYDEKMDICKLLQLCMRNYERDKLMRISEDICDGLRTTVMDPRHKGGFGEEVKRCLEDLLLNIYHQHFTPGSFQNETNRAQEWYNKLTLHNLENIEPFLVRPELGYFATALEFLTPWIKHPFEIQQKAFIKKRVLEIAFTSMKSAIMLDTVQGILEAVNKILPLFEREEARNLIASLYEMKDQVFARIMEEFPILLEISCTLWKINILSKNTIAPEDIVNELRPAFTNRARSRASEKAAIEFIRWLVELGEDESVLLALKKLVEQFFCDHFASRLAVTISNKLPFTPLQGIIFLNFNSDNCIEILNYFIEDNVESKQVIDWLIHEKPSQDSFIENLRNSQILLDLSEIVFKIGIKSGYHLNPKTWNNISHHPYMVLLLIRSKANDPNISLAHYHELWHSFHPRIDQALRYASLLSGEENFKSKALPDIIEIKTKFLKKNSKSDYDTLNTWWLNSMSIEAFSADVLFDFKSAWFNPELLNIKIEGSEDMDYREKVIIELFQPILTFLQKNPERLPIFLDIFDPALKLLDSIEAFKYDKTIYYKTIMNFLWNSIKGEEIITEEKMKLLSLLPDLLKHISQDVDIKDLIESLTKTLNATKDNKFILCAVNILVGVVKQSSAVVANERIRKKLVKCADVQTINCNRRIRYLATALKKALGKAEKS